MPKIYIVHSPFKKDPRQIPEKQEMLKNISDQILPNINAIAHITKYNFDQWTVIFPETKTKSRIIYHGIPTSDIKWTGEISKAISAVYNLPERIECGLELYQKVSQKVPIDLYGFNSEKFGGLGPLANDKLKIKFAKHRAYFNSTTASSVPMAMLEAMSVGTPVVTASTTELPNIIKNGENGFISNDSDFLIEKLQLLIEDRDLSKRMGEEAQKTIRKSFSIKRFIKEWNGLFYESL